MPHHDSENAPRVGNPPGTCQLTSLRGHVLLGGVEGTWTVEIARERGWCARVWGPGAAGQTTVVRPVEVRARPGYVQEDGEDLIETMIWAAQQAHRELAEDLYRARLTRIGDDLRVGVVDPSERCQERSPSIGEADGIPCIRQEGHDGPHSWERRQTPEHGDALDTCGAGGRAPGYGCTHVAGHAGPHSWERVVSDEEWAERRGVSLPCKARSPRIVGGLGEIECTLYAGHPGPHSWAPSGDALDTCGEMGGTAHGCTFARGHAGPHSWQRGG